MKIKKNDWKSQQSVGECAFFDMFWCQVVLIASSGAAFDLPESKISPQRKKQKKKTEGNKEIFLFFNDTIIQTKPKRTKTK